MIPLTLTPEHLMTALGWVFDKVAGTVPASGGPRLSDREINRAIALACTTAGAAGFVSNLGGLLTLPIALPANMVGVAAVQLKLITTVAAGRGYDVHSEEVRTVCIACLTGNAALDIVKEAGIQAGLRLGQRAVGQITAATLARINQVVGFQLLSKAGTQGLVNLSKVVPLIGGLVGGSFDAASTRAVGAVAKTLFPPLDLPPPPPPSPELKVIA